MELPVLPPFPQVNGHDVTSVADDVAMTILRSSPRRLSMTLGRAVTNLVAPAACDSLPDIVLHKTPSGQLGEITCVCFRTFQRRDWDILQRVRIFHRYKVDRWHWQQMAGHLLPGGGAGLPSQRGGKRPAQ